MKVYPIIRLPKESFSIEFVKSSVLTIMAVEFNGNDVVVVVGNVVSAVDVVVSVGVFAI